MKLSRFFRAGLLAALSLTSLAVIPSAFADQPAPYVCTASYTGASVAANTTSTTTISCPGAALGDVILGVSDTASIGAFQLYAYVSAAGTITINISNVSAGALTPATGTLTAVGRHVFVPPLIIN